MRRPLRLRLLRASALCAAGPPLERARETVAGGRVGGATSAGLVRAVAGRWRRRAENGGQWPGRPRALIGAPSTSSASGFRAIGLGLNLFKIGPRFQFCRRCRRRSPFKFIFSPSLLIYQRKRLTLLLLLLLLKTSKKKKKKGIDLRPAGWELQIM